MGKSKSSHQWLQEHFQDEYVKRTHALGVRSRAFFKLQEIQQKDKLIKPAMNVLDLGAAPGGWSEFARKIISKKKRVIALDILPLKPIPGVTFIQGDFREDEVLNKLFVHLDDSPIDVVLSDMAPNISGNKAVDQPRSIYLGELALDTAKTVLVQDGAFLVKMFQGQGFDEFYNVVRQSFSKVVIRKPKASRPRSNEVYILAQGFKKSG